MDNRDIEINWLHFALQAGGVGAWDWNLAENKLMWNEAMRHVLGFPSDYRPNAEDFFAHIHPEDRPRVEAEIQATVAGEADLNSEFCFIRPPGDMIWLSCSARCFRNTAGKAVRILGVATDVTERHRAREQDMAFMREMVHRMKNTITLVSGIVTLTERQADTVPEFAALLKGRLNTLAETSNMLVQSDYHHAELYSLVTHALQAFNLGRRIFVNVPRVHLKEQAAQLIALMLHELATNAMKHGALATPTGRVYLDIGWVDGGEMVLEWREAGTGGAVHPPRNGPQEKGEASANGRSGDGMEILIRAVRYLCSETPRIEWNEEGILYRARLRAEAVLVDPDAGAAKASVAKGS